MYCIRCAREFHPRSPDVTLCPGCGGPPEAAGYSADLLDEPISVVQPSMHQVAPQQSGRIFDENTTPAEWQDGDSLLDTYTVLGLLGKGGMAKVYRVRHLLWNIDLAVKSPLAFRTQEQREWFISEGETWIGLGLHPHIVSCYYVRTLGGIPRIFAELVEGGSLLDWINQGRITTIEQALDIAIQFAWGLAYAHERGLVHRDVKPANVLMTPDGIAKVTDFGLVKAGKGMTPAYASPEQAESQQRDLEITPRSDMWSWGLSVLEMFAGSRFWVKHEMPDYAWGVVAPHALEHYLSGSSEDSAIPEMPDQLAGLIRRCFDEAPSKRPEALEAVRCLQEIYQAETGQPYPRKMPREAEQLADSLNNKALSLLDLGNESAAVAAWEEALQSNPSHLEANYNLGYWEWIHGKREDLSLHQNIAELDAVYGERPAYWLARAKLSYERGDLQQATMCEQKARQLGERLSPIQGGCDIRQEQVIQNPNGLYCLRLSPDGRFLLAGGLDKTIRLYDLSTNSVIKTYTAEYNHGEIYTIGVPPNWALVLCESGFGKIEVWETHSGRHLGTLEDKNITASSASTISVLEFTPDGRILLSAVREHFGLRDIQAIHLWDIRTGKRIGSLEGHPHSVYNLVVSPNGRTAISSGWSDQGEFIKVWDLASQQCMRVLSEQSVRAECLAISADGNYLLSGNDDGSVGYWDLRTWRLVRRFTGHSAPVSSVAFHPTGEYALSGSEDRTARFWDVRSGKCLRTLNDHTNTVHAVLFSADGRLTYTASKDGTIRRYTTQLSTRRCCDYLISTPVSAEKTIDNQDQVSRMLEEADDLLGAGRCAEAYHLLRSAQAVHGFEKAAPVLDRLHQSEQGAHRGELLSAWLIQTMSGHSDVIHDVDLSKDGRLAVSASSDRTVRVWDTRKGTCVACIEAHTRPLSAAKFSPGGEMLATASRDYYMASEAGDQFLRLWEVRGIKQIHDFKKFDQSVNTLTFSPDGKSLFVARTEMIADKGENYIQAFDVRTGGQIHAFNGHKDVVTCLAAFGGGKYLLSGSKDETLKIWNAVTGECLKTLHGHKGNIHALTVIGDGRFALSGGVDNLIRLWDLTSGTCVRELEGHADTIHAIAVTSDGQFALSGGEEFALRLWDLRSWRVLQVLEGHTDGVTSIAFSGDGRYAVSGSYDKTVKVWEFDWEWIFE
jgi:WD40 repeat protein